MNSGGGRCKSLSASGMEFGFVSCLQTYDYEEDVFGQTRRNLEKDSIACSQANVESRKEEDKSNVCVEYQLQRPEGVGG